MHCVNAAGTDIRACRPRETSSGPRDRNRLGAESTRVLMPGKGFRPAITVIYLRSSRRGRKSEAGNTLCPGGERKDDLCATRFDDSRKRNPQRRAAAVRERYSSSKPNRYLTGTAPKEASQTRPNGNRWIWALTNSKSSMSERPRSAARWSPGDAATHQTTGRRASTGRAANRRCFLPGRPRLGPLSG